MEKLPTYLGMSINSLLSAFLLHSQCQELEVGTVA